MISAYGWEVMHMDQRDSQELLKAQSPKIGLLVTNRVDLLDGLTPDIPVILTLAEGAEAPPVPRVRHLTLLVLLRKPLAFGATRNAIERYTKRSAAPLFQVVPITGITSQAFSSDTGGQPEPPAIRRT